MHKNGNLVEKTTDGFAKKGGLIMDANLCKVRPEGCYNEREEVTESPREVAGVHIICLLL